MPLSQDEKEKLSDRIVAVVRDPNRDDCLAKLKQSIDAGDEGPDGMNSMVYALALAMVEEIKKR